MGNFNIVNVLGNIFGAQAITSKCLNFNFCHKILRVFNYYIKSKFYHKQSSEILINISVYTVKPIFQKLYFHM